MGLFDVFSNNAAEQAARDRASGLNAGYDKASGFYDQGRAALSTNATTAAQPFTALFDQSQKGSSAYADASGANGPEGLARAKALFTATPGYSEGINLALDANDRRAASRGLLGSGNTIADTTKLATDYASTKFGDYRGGLLPFLGQGTSAAQGLGNIYTNLGNQTNQNLTGEGDLAFKTQTGIGDANAAADLNKYNVSKNLWGALGALGGTALNAVGGAGGFSNLFSGFGGAGGLGMQSGKGGF